MKRSAFILVLALCGVLLAPIRAAWSRAFPTPQDTLIYCSEGMPEGFDPAQYTTGTTYDVAQPVFSRLVDFKQGSTLIEESGHTQSSLALSWDISSDGLSYTFHLRKGVHFHDRPWFHPTRDLTADDVIFTFRRGTDPSLPFNKAHPASFPLYADMELVANIASIEKSDSLTVVIKLRKQDAAFLQKLAMSFAAIHSKEYAELLLKKGRAEEINQYPVGTGPFMFKSYQQDSVIRYEKNPSYWAAGGVGLQKLIYVITPESAIRVAKLRRGECHVAAYIKPLDLAAVRSDPHLKLLEQSGLNISYLAFNTQKTPLTNVKVREALSVAIHRDAILSSVYRGSGQKLDTMMPKTQWGVNKRVKLPTYDATESPARAKEMLTKEGYPNGFEITLWAPSAQRVYNPNALLTAQLIQQDWRKIGVQARIVTYEWGEYMKRLKAGEHDTALTGWNGDNGDPDNWTSALLSCAAIGGSNLSRWCYPPFEDVIKKARQETNRTKRIELYAKAQMIVAAQWPALPLASSMNYVATNADVVGFKISPLSVMDFSHVRRENQAQ